MMQAANGFEPQITADDADFADFQSAKSASSAVICGSNPLAVYDARL
jgi:hypothetical protein